MEHTCPKVLNKPAHPSWREGKVSPKLYTTGHGIYRRTSNSSMINDPKGQSRIELYLMPGRLNTLNNNGNIPLFTKCLSCCVVYLTWSGWPCRHTSFQVSIPPSIIIRWLCEQFPNIFNRSSHICCWANANYHNVHLRSMNTPCMLLTGAGGDTPHSYTERAWE